MCEGVCDPVCDESDLLRAQADTWLRQGGVVEDDEARLLWPSEEAVDHPKLRVLQALLLAVGRQTPVRMTAHAFAHALHIACLSHVLVVITADLCA